MSTPFKPRRSVLYMPGINARALDKARGLDADAFIFDLEDAVAPDQKSEARDQICEAIVQGGYRPREVIVRVNGLDTQWAKDDIQQIASLAPGSFDAMLIPKVESAAMVEDALAHMDNAGGTQLALWVMVETPQGLLRVEDIATASERLDCLVMGTSDLSNELRVPHTPNRLGFLYALSRCVVAARAAGNDILDGVYLGLNDPAGFRTVCEQGVELGFDGKTLIHPNQLATANDVFGPSEDDVEHARNVVNAWNEALRAGQGVVVVDGKLVENLHFAEAERTLSVAEAIAQRGG
ncbi:MAG: CoA ester lyase [Pseudomonadota bacterium]